MCSSAVYGVDDSGKYNDSTQWLIQSVKNKKISNLVFIVKNVFSSIWN